MEEGSETKVKFVNKGYQAVIPNYEDWAYIKVAMDAHSTKFLIDNFKKIDCGLTKLLIIRSFFEGVKDAKLRADNFTDMLLDKFFLEEKIENTLLFKSVFEILSSAVWDHLPKKHMIKCGMKVFEKLERLLEHQTTPETRKFIVKELITFAYSEPSIAYLASLLDKELENQESDVGISDKWRIVFKIHASKLISAENKRNFLDRMDKLDQSDAQKNTKLSIEALTANLSQREALWKKYTNREMMLSFGDLSYSMSGFFSLLVEEERRAPFYSRFYEDVTDVIAYQSKSHAETFLHNGAPDLDDDKDAIKILEKIGAGIPQANQYFKIEIRKIVDRLRKKEAIFALFKD